MFRTDPQLGQDKMDAENPPQFLRGQWLHRWLVPEAGLIMDRSGNLYGTTNAGRRKPETTGAPYSS